jgi:hypothetical protein
MVREAKCQLNDHGRSAYCFQRLGDCGFDLARAIAAEFAIHIFEPADEVEDFFASVRATGSFAEMRATTERSVRINQAATGFEFEEWARASSGFWKVFSARGAKGYGGDESFSFGKVGSLPGELELATLGAGLTIAFQRSLCQFCIHCPDFAKGLLYLVSPHVARKIMRDLMPKLFWSFQRKSRYASVGGRRLGTGVNS